MWITGNFLITRVRGLRGMNWSLFEKVPGSHPNHVEIPAMGGIGLVASAFLVHTGMVVSLVTLSAAVNGHVVVRQITEFPQFFLLQFCATLYAGSGMVGDWSKGAGRGGPSAYVKLATQYVFAWAFLVGLQITGEISFLRGGRDPLSSLIVLSSVIVGTSNAVKLTDGIDGLVVGLTFEMGLVGLSLSHWLNLVRVSPPSPFEVPVLWACLGGSSLGFLTFNRHPARVLLGDTGSLALGAALGAGAVALRAVFLLPFIGFIFFVELFSVILQIAWFKFTRLRYGEGRRIFRRAPLHHHFELAGWSEWRVVVTFWGINAVTSLIGLTLWWRGDLPRFP